MGTTPRFQSVLVDLERFRKSLTRDLTTYAAIDPRNADRSAAQDGLQLIWSFVASSLGTGESLSDSSLELLRAAFPDELFEPDADAKFSELAQNVPTEYADQWKYLPSDHLCVLIRGCVNSADAHPVNLYRELGVQLACSTVDACQQLQAKSVFALAKFDSMLKHARVLTEVAVSEVSVPTNDQIKAFYLTADHEHSLSFAFLTRIDPGQAESMVRVFALQHGSQTTKDLLATTIAELVNEPDTAALIRLQESL